VDKLVIHQTTSISYKAFTPDTPIAAAPPLVLIHGFAEDSSVWDHQAAYLKNNHRLIIPDLPGCGRSSPLSGDTSMEELAGTVKAVLDAEGISECILIGHSMGGYITLAFAELYPDMLKAFGLFHSTSYADSEEKKAIRRKAIDFIRKNGSAPFIRQSTPNLFSESTRKEHPDWVNTLIERYADFDPAPLISYYEAMIRRPDRSHILQQFPRPVLFIIGEQDSAIPLNISLQQSHMPRVSYIYILEHAGHMGMIEEAERSSHILEELLNESI